MGSSGLGGSRVRIQPLCEILIPLLANLTQIQPAWIFTTSLYGTDPSRFIEAGAALLGGKGYEFPFLWAELQAVPTLTGLAKWPACSNVG